MKDKGTGEMRWPRDPGFWWGPGCSFRCSISGGSCFDAGRSCGLAPYLALFAVGVRCNSSGRRSLRGPDPLIVTSNFGLFLGDAKPESLNSFAPSITYRYLKHGIGHY